MIGELLEITTTCFFESCFGKLSSTIEHMANSSGFDHQKSIEPGGTTILINGRI
jgi:hypothetical protein